jgi:CBS domain-containing protein
MRGILAVRPCRAAAIGYGHPVAGIDPATYLRATPPFGLLPAELFGEVARAVEVVFHPAGNHLVRAGGAPLQHLYVIRKGAVRLERDGQTVQLVEEGETFGYTSLLTGQATLDVLVEADLVAYRLPARAFRALLSDGRFASHFAAGMGERLRASLEHAPVAAFRADVAGAVETLLRREPVWFEEAATVGEAARMMRHEGVSSVLVRGSPPGIVTDRDFRNRVLAEDLGPETPLAPLVSRPLRTVPAGTPIYAAWRILLDTGGHHLPVERGGEIVGVLTSGDLLRHSAQGPVAVLRAVERLPDRSSLPGYGRRVAEMVSMLLAGGLDATVIAAFVARLNDALLQRLLRWAEEDLGPAPAPYAWIALGSEGRMEQTLLTDQDNALVYADEGGAAREWYAALACRVNEDLVAAGFPECPGGHMARNHHGTLAEWRRRVAACLERPDPHDAEILLDHRPAAGRLDVSVLAEDLARAGPSSLLLRLLVREALEFSPPSALVLRLRGDASVVDLKAHGIQPIVFLARCYGLEAGGTRRSTLERLEAAVQAGIMDGGLHATVVEAYRFLIGLRLRLQLRDLAEGTPPRNRIPLVALTPVERSRLRDAFRAVKSWQEKAAYHYQATG